MAMNEYERRMHLVTLWCKDKNTWEQLVEKKRSTDKFQGTENLKFAVLVYFFYVYVSILIFRKTDERTESAKIATRLPDYRVCRSSTLCRFILLKN